MAARLIAAVRREEGWTIVVSRTPARRRSLGSALALALVGAAAAAPPALAATPCPNEAIRAQQGATRLPDCRAYELVSPVDKGGSALRQAMAVRAGGDAVAYWSTGAFAGAPSNIAGNYVARRTGDGWVTRSLNAPTHGRNPVLMDQPYLVAMSDDFSRALIDTRYPVDPADAFLGTGINAGMPDLYRSDPDGSVTWLTPAAQLPDLSGREVSFGAATGDLETVVFRTAKQVLPDLDAGSAQQLYVRHGGTVRLLSADADGRPLSGGALLGRSVAGLWTGSGTLVGGKSPSALSADGQTAWFSSTAGLPQLFVRTDALDPAAAATVQVSASQASATRGANCGGSYGAIFLAAAADGATAYLSCSSQLTDDPAPLGGVYRYDRGSGKLALVAANRLSADVAPVAADPRADHVWVSSRAQLTADAPAGGQTGLYVIHGGVARYVGPLASTLPPSDAAISPDGSQLAFAAAVAIDPRANGTKQVYLADASGALPVCVSCRPDGTTSAGIADFVNAGATDFLQSNRAVPRGAVRDDGTVTFVSADALLPEDGNDVADVYQRRRDGTLALLSSGRDTLPSVFGGASDDGRDVFILTSERLVAQDTDNGSADLYSARVDGGFPAPEGPQPICEEGCQGPPQPPYVPPPAESGIFTGPGDVLDPAPPRGPSFAVAKIGARKRAAWAKRGRTTLVVRASHAGTVRAVVRGRIGRRAVRVASAARRLAGPGRAKLTLRLSGRARRQLARHRRLRVTVTVTHSRVSGAKRATVVLRKPAVKRTKGGKR